MRAEAGFAPAKINLTLHVTGLRADGYHLLDSLVVRADVCDRLTVAPSDDLTLTVTGPFARGVPTDARNLVLRAARLLDPDRGAAITLEKHLPHAAGIGGGSADAAAVLHLLSDLWGVPIPDDVIVLGADVPACMTVLPQRMRGVGEKLNPVDLVPDLPLVLVNPGVPVPTADVFARLATKANPPMPESIPAFRTAGALIDWLAQHRNDLQAPACALVPQVAAVLEALRPHVRLARMSGSGGTCFGICDDAEAVAAQIRRAHPGWWVAATRMI